MYVNRPHDLHAVAANNTTASRPIALDCVDRGLRPVQRILSGRKKHAGVRHGRQDNNTNNDLLKYRSNELARTVPVCWLNHLRVGLNTEWAVSQIWETHIGL